MDLGEAAFAGALIAAWSTTPRRCGRPSGSRFLTRRCA